MKTILYLFSAFCLLGIITSSSSCKHDPTFVVDDDMMPVDTTNNPVDTMDNPVDTTMGNPCDPEVVYFEQEVLPILISNCALSGCHGADNPQEGVQLTSYQMVVQTGEVTPFNLGESDLYEVLVEDDVDKRMPPSPSSPLSSEQISLIAEWILQGAENLTCDMDSTLCDTENVSFSGMVKPLIDMHCLGCHSGNNPGGGILLTDHTTIASAANSGNLYGAIAHEEGFEPMPQGADQLDSCSIAQIKSWVDAGAPNN